MRVTDKTFLLTGVRVSGVFGITVSFGLVGLATASEDGVIGLDLLYLDEPTLLAVTTLLAGSLVALAYVDLLAQFGSWLDFVTVLFLVAQWGTPLSIYLADGQQLTVYNFLTVVLVSLHVLVGLLVLGKTVQSFPE